ncbi:MULTISPECIES: hypothetical protein [Streptomyces]|nr:MULTISPECIES: hypothetical protein [Streptomyces]
MDAAQPAGQETIERSIRVTERLYPEEFRRPLAVEAGGALRCESLSSGRR